MKATVEAHVEVVQKALEPWDAGRAYLNFAERSTTGQRLFGAETYARLRRVKAQYEPHELTRSNHPPAVSSSGAAHSGSLAHARASDLDSDNDDGSPRLRPGRRAVAAPLLHSSAAWGGVAQLVRAAES